MKSIKQKFRNLKTRYKLLFSSILLILLCSFGIGGLSYLVASKIIYEQTLQQSQETILELSNNIDKQYDMILSAFSYISNSDIVHEELKSSNPYQSNGTDFYSFYSRPGQIRRLLLQGYSSVRMYDIELYGNNGSDFRVSQDNNQYVSNEYVVFQLAKEANGKCIIYNDKKTKSLQMVKEIKDALSMKSLGILRASVKVSYLDKMTEKVKLATDGSILLLDTKDGDIINDTDIDSRQLLGNISGNHGNFMYQSEKGKYCIIYQRSNDTGFLMVGMIPMNYLYQTLSGFQDIIFFIIVIGIIIGIVLSQFLAKGIVGPIEKTCDAMKKFANGDFSVRLEENRTDEIGIMNRVFNDTVSEVDLLMHQIVEKESLSHEMEFKMLQAQINPHFLYNVLDTINWMARKKGEDTICNIVVSVSNIMRASISNKKDVVTLKEELSYVNAYIYIQQIRYKDRFTANAYLDEVIESFQIPKFTIQTLVENAIVHGIENASWECRLYVLVEEQKDKIRITVRDTGIGMDEETMQHLFDSVEEQHLSDNTSHTSLGVYAVKKRLEYLYGEKVVMKIESEKGKGTEISVLIPNASNVEEGQV